MPFTNSANLSNNFPLTDKMQQQEKEKEILVGHFGSLQESGNVILTTMISVT